MDLTVAFNRSILFDLNTICVSRGFNILKMMARVGK